MPDVTPSFDPDTNPSPAKARITGPVLLLTAVLAGVVYALSSPFSAAPASRSEPYPPIAQSDVANETAQLPATPQPLTPAELFARSSPSIVKVSATDKRPGGRSGFGTGFFVQSSELVATNHHVIANADEATIILSDGSEWPVLGVAAWDKQADVAILKVAGPATMRPLELGGEDLPAIGERVYAIGNPAGFINTLSDGLVSGHRARGTVPHFPDMPKLIQIAAPISHGSSGGPLMSADGRVVGVVTLTFAVDLEKRAQINENLNLAVPICHVARLLHEVQGPTANLPMSREPAGYAAQTSDGWTSEDVANAARFVRAIRTMSTAFAICSESDRRGWQPGDPPQILGPGGQVQAKTGRPWLLSPRERDEFRRLCYSAWEDARLTRKDVLKRIHPALPYAFDDFIHTVSYLAINADHPNSNQAAQWRRWSDWWAANKRDAQIPAGAK
jgi:S1-C subfamily serine protease